ncbi:MAG: PilT/PilU family type 4a pilus ATPase [Clostridia bacterium]|nr:PilT/PilU family type 4a pilus ATPase [Clostridia bacterium]
MENIRTYLETAVNENAADLFLIAGKPVSIKRAGEIRSISDGFLLPKDVEALVRDIYELAQRPLPESPHGWDDDFSTSLPGLARFRVNIFRQRGSLAAVMRVVKFGIPSWEDLSIPDEVMKISERTRGLVLVTGPAGSGKSTTLACVVDRINQTRNAHIITIEDPIEYLHSHREGIVSQRELNVDTESYVTALRASLRQAPDVILLGEMRDLDTIQTAMTAAETGHLVISTLHTVGAVNTIDRIIDVFPPGQQQQIRVQLSQVLRTVVSQQLLPTVDGGLTPAFEIMHLNNAIRTLVRDSRIHQIDAAIQTGSGEGMISMDNSILALVKAGRITKDTAVHYAMNPDQMIKKA